MWVEASFASKPASEPLHAAQQDSPGKRRLAFFVTSLTHGRFLRIASRTFFPLT